MPASISGTLPASSRLLYPGDDAHQRQWILRHQPSLDDGKIEKLVSYLCSLETSSPELNQTIRKAAAYFQRNAERMRYPAFCRQHLFVGSGVIEAGCNAGCIVTQSLPLTSPASKSFGRFFAPHKRSRP
jgi:hypothetical protein